MQNFEYLAPESLSEALSLLSRQAGNTIVMAGGTDLLPNMKNNGLRTERIIDLKRIPGLKSISYSEDDGLRIGALTTVRDIETSKVIREKFNVLSQAAGTLGSVQIRNKATVGGNLCSAAPSADLPPALIGLSATVRIAGGNGDRTLPLEEFFTGPFETILGNDEILTEIAVPNVARFSAGAYIKFSPRRAMDLAIVGVAVALTMDPAKSTCSDIRIVLGAVAPTPMRAKKAEGVLKGNKLTDTLIEEAASLAAAEAKPISDIRASEWYRREIIKVLIHSTINRALERMALKGTAER